jgi:hypothetical protein
MILEISVGTMQIKYPTYRRKSKANSRTCCNVYHSSRPRLPAEESSDTAMCHVAPDSAFHWGGLRRCHMSHNFGPASLLRMATTLPRVPRLQTAAGLKYKGSHHWLSRAFKIHVFPRRTRTQVPKAHSYSATMSDKGRTRLTDATTTSKTGITRQQVATVQPPATIRC